METFVYVFDTAYPTDTIEQIAEAKTALAEAGMQSAPVYAGDSDGDNHRNGQVLWAASTAMVAE